MLRLNLANDHDRRTAEEIVMGVSQKRSASDGSASRSIPERGRRRHRRRKKARNRRKQRERRKNVRTTERQEGGPQRPPVSVRRGGDSSNCGLAVVRKSPILVDPARDVLSIALQKTEDKNGDEKDKRRLDLDSSPNASSVSQPNDMTTKSSAIAKKGPILSNKDQDIPLNEHKSNDQETPSLLSTEPGNSLVNRKMLFAWFFSSFS